MGNNPMKQIMINANEQIRRRELQIDNQIASINRLARNEGWTYDDEMGKLQQELAKAQLARQEAQDELNAMKRKYEPTK